MKGKIDLDKIIYLINQLPFSKKMSNTVSYKQQSNSQRCYENSKY